MKIEAPDQVRQYLQAIREMRMRSTRLPDLKHSCIEDLLLTYGRDAQAYPALVVPGTAIRVAPGRMKECYYNAWTVATDGFQSDPDLLYTEGVGLSYGIPMSHAWLTHLPTGTVIDPTWKRIEGQPTVYLGVVFAAEFVRERSLVTQSPSMLAPNEMTPREFLQQGFVTDENGVVTGLGKN